jgi:Proteins containing SET domain
MKKTTYFFLVIIFPKVFSFAPHLTNSQHRYSTMPSSSACSEFEALNSDLLSSPALSSFRFTASSKMTFPAPDPEPFVIPDTLKDVIPDGIELRKASHGFGMFATKFFAKGTTLYTGFQIVVPNIFRRFKLVTNQGTFDLDTDTHSVQCSETERWLYLFDSFMNHSCDPTTISRQSSEQRERNEYDTVALRDISPGDEITCDYLAFEYDCYGKVIEKCLCGAPQCVGRIAGFRFLSTEQQKARIHIVDDEVLLRMSEDPENKLLYVQDLKCPTDRVQIVQSDTTDIKKGFKMIASRSYEPGDVIYRNSSLLYPEDLDIVVKLDQHKIWLSKSDHTVNRGDGKREFFYFDTFQNHSCSPNTMMSYFSEDDYELIATLPIKEGDELTSDYEAFDEGLDGTQFTCLCGSKN